MARPTSVVSFAPFIDCQDFASALREALILHYKKSDRINLSDFSRRAGFSSRSYISEILSDKKGLSRDALLRIRTTLKLPKPLLEILDLLAYLNTPALRPPQIPEAEVSKRLATARSKLHSLGREKPAAKRRDSSFVRSTTLYQVYAGLGSLTKGADLATIIARTRLSEVDVKASLAQLLKNGIISQKDAIYFATESQIDNFGLQARDGLSALVSEACGNIRLNRTKIIDTPGNLVFYTAFSMDCDRSTQLKERLREAIFQVFDEFQNDDGDCVKQMMFALYG